MINVGDITNFTCIEDKKKWCYDIFFNKKNQSHIYLEIRQGLWYEKTKQNKKQQN